MNEKEKKEFYIAMCNCCLIAQTMKSCQVCHFNTGRTEQVQPIDAVLLQTPISAPFLQCPNNTN